MERKIEAVLRFQALLQYAATSDDDVSLDLHRQKDLLVTLGVTAGQINDLIHDRHVRLTPTVLALVRQIAAERAQKRQYGAASGAYRYKEPPPPRTKTREELAEEYLKAKGKG